MIEIIEKRKGNGQLIFATVKVNGSVKEYEVDSEGGCDRYLLYDNINIDMLYGEEIKELPSNIIFSTRSSHDLPKCFSLIEIARKNEIFEINLICSINAIEWHYPYNINDYFYGLEEIANVDFGPEVTFLNETSDSDKYYDFSIKIQIHGVLEQVRKGIESATTVFNQCNKKALERLGRYDASADIVDIKPNMFGIGINVNEIIRIINKEKNWLSG